MEPGKEPTKKRGNIYIYIYNIKGKIRLYSNNKISNNNNKKKTGLLLWDLSSKNMSVLKKRGDGGNALTRWLYNTRHNTPCHISLGAPHARITAARTQKSTKTAKTKREHAHIPRSSFKKEKNRKNTVLKDLKSNQICRQNMSERYTSNFTF